MNKKLIDYLKECTTHTCRWCGGALSNDIDHYDHSDGWLVDGFDTRQWLSRKCKVCEYEWSLNKLGVSRD